MASKLSHFLAELKRRKVYRVGAVYAGTAVALIGIADGLLPEPTWESLKTPVAILLLVGFPVSLALAWAYEVKREKPRTVESASQDTPSLSDTPGSSSEATAHTRPSASAHGKSIVVLPFDNLSPDPADAYFSDGLTEEIITDLSFLESLRVISRSSAMALKGTTKDVPSLARELKVGFVLEGSVRKAGQDLRITAQLIDAESDAHIWAERYHGTLDDVFGIQEEVSRAIVKALQLKLNPEEEEHLSDNPIGDPEAYDLYLKAQRETQIVTEASLVRASDYLQAASEIVGENALIYAEMAEVDFYYLDTMVRPGPETLDHAEQLAWKSMKLDPGLALAHHQLGRIERYRGTHTAAIRHFEQAYRIDPNHSQNLLWLGWMYSLFLGKPESAKVYADRLVGVDPIFVMRHVPLAFIAWMEGRYDEALRHLDDGSKETPELRWFLFFKTQVLARRGDREGALAVIDEVMAKDVSDGVGPLCSLFRTALVRDETAFQVQLTDTFKETLWNDPECPFWMAGWCSLLNRVDDAMEWLDRAVERGWVNYPLLSRDDPFLEAVRGDPRFGKLMDRMKREWENFEV